MTHSREPLSLTMSMLITINLLKGLTQGDHNRFKELMRDNIIGIIPFVNPDSYIFINENWDSPHKNQVLMIRKNRKIHPNCDQFTGGVDINRNFAMKFAQDNLGSSDNPCQEDYRGTHAFSEPESIAIKDYVD